MNKYRIVTELDKEQWEAFINQQPDGNIFQSPDMLKLFKKTKNYDPIIIAVKDGNDAIMAILLAVIQRESKGILGYFSSRTVVWGGPIINSQKDTELATLVLEPLLKELIKMARVRSIYIQIRNLFLIDKYMSSFRKYGFQFQKHLNFHVPTVHKHDTEKRISKSKIRQIRKSLKSGARIIEPDNIEKVKQFYDILKKLYKTKVKRPLPHWSFFEFFFSQSKKNQLGKYFLIEYSNEIVGGIMCPITKGKAIHEWYICGLDGVCPGIYPSVLATWAAIDYALKNKLQYFDFMGAGKPDQDYGVREFKSKFGGDMVEFGRFERINNKLFYLAGKIGLKIIGRFSK
jgi:lipid II:glycine glycyltransferase (peptidoglycan interpeptide bridge formation enzyme)